MTTQTLADGPAADLCRGVPSVKGFRVSPQQLRTWRFRQGFDDRRSWCLFDLPPEWPRDNLRDLIHSLVARHEILRTRYSRQDDGSPLQIISPEASALVEAVDLGSLPPVAVEKRLGQLLAREGAAPATPAALRCLEVALPKGRHLLLLSLPALSADGTTFELLARELDAGNRPEADREETVQYLQFSEWQNELAEEGDGSGAGARWRIRLEEELPGPARLGELAREGASGAEGSLAGFSPRSLALEIAEEALAAGVSAGLGEDSAQVLLLAWLIFQSRVAGTPEVAVAYLSAGRTFDDLTAVPGLMDQALPLAGLLPGDQSGRRAAALVRSLLRTREESEEILPWLAGDLSVPALCHAFEDRRLLGCERLSLLEEGVAFEPYLLKLTFRRQASAGRVLLGYDSAALDRAEAQRFGRIFCRLLEDLLTRPEVPVSALQTLSVGERHELLVERNQQCAPPPAQTFMETFLAVAQRHADDPALRFEEEALSYRQLESATMKLASALRRRGVGLEDRVAIYCQRSTSMIVALLGVLRAGAAYVPLDPGLPAERLEWILKDSDARLVLIQDALGTAALPPRWLKEDSPCLLLLAEALAETGPPYEELPGWDPRHLAYVMYTSGSTGNPKGVAVEHRQLSGYLRAVLLRLDLPAGCSYAVISTPAADLGNTMIFAALATGSTLHVLSEDRARDPFALTEYLRRHPVDCLKIVPAHLQALEGEVDSKDLLPRRCLVVGGEASSRDWLARLRSKAPHLAIVNHYGPTETTVGTLTFRLAPRDPLPAVATLPVGRPLDNGRQYLLDPTLAPVAAGLKGEICIGGHGLARGYWGAPARTAEAFIPDPYAGSPGARLYRTGDLGRLTVAGEVEFLGRKDHQVKIRGFRVEPGEIEATLRRRVAQAAVLTEKDASGALRLVAFVAGVATGGDPSETDQAELKEGGLRTWLEERLPAHLVPSSIVVLPSLPITANGKLDRKALLALKRAPARVRPVVPPRTEVERSVAALWSELLGVEGPSLEDNFFDFGGHSLLATRLVSRLRHTFHVEVSLRHLFEVPTLGALSATVERAMGDGSESSWEGIAAIASDGDRPLSFAQQRLWFLNRLHPGDAVYNSPRVIRVRGKLNLAALEKALLEIVRRHEVLRSVYLLEGEEPCQRVVSVDRLPAPRVELRGLPRELREREGRRLAAREVRRPFRLHRDLMLRLLSIRLAEDEWQLVLVTHHIASDAWSIGILVRELGVLYASFAAGGTESLAPLPLQYADFASWQRQHLQGEVLIKEVSFWRAQLAGLPPILNLPTDRPWSQVASTSGGREVLVLPAAVGEAVESLARSSGATLSMALLAVFQTLLFRVSQQGDLAVGQPIAGRNRAETEGLIGFFVNTLVMRGRIHGEDSFSSLLGQLRETCLAAFDHQDLPFEKLVEELKPPRHLGATPLFQVTFNLLNTPNEAAALPGLTLDMEAVETVALTFPLGLTVSPIHEGLQLAMSYRRDLFDQVTVSRMLGHLRALLEGSLAAPDAAVGRLSLLSPAQRHATLVELNDTGLRTEATTIVDLFARQAAANPGRLALMGEGERLSFGELEDKARRIAFALRARGVAREDVVALALPRSVSLVVGMLGILRAGAAFLPLDLRSPKGRLRAMLKAAGVRYVLVSGEIPDCLGEGQEELSLEDLASTGFESGALPTILPATAAYVVYTSGSTGHPKGVVVEHQHLAGHLRATLPLLDLPPACRFAMVSTPAADLGHTMLFGALASGGTLYLPGEETVADPEVMAGYFAQHPVDCLKIVPSHLRALQEGVSLERLLPARCLIVAGEGSPRDWIEEVRRVKPELVLINSYGPTEAAVNAIALRLGPGEETPGSAQLPLGRPLAESRTYLLDPELAPVPMGLRGEIFLAGFGLARGYLGDPRQTAERFLPDPFAAQAGVRMYRTGDFGRLLPNLTVEFLGRDDQQVKIRGFRVELGEVEAALRKVLGEAVAVVRKDAAGNDSLYAFAVVRQGSEGDGSGAGDSYQSELRKLLPAHFLPSGITFLPSMPLTPAGKVDRQALKSLEATATGPREVVEPRNPFERLVAEVWTEVLGVEKPSVHDDFFAHGGHSLLAVRLISRLRRTLEVEISLRGLFENPTLEAIARAVEERFAGGGQRTERIVPVPRDRDLPLSFAQQRLWFLDRLDPGSITYNSPRAVRIEGLLKIVHLQGALQEIVRRHEALRTVFPERDGAPVQVIRQASPLPLPVLDLSGLAPALREKEARKLVRREIRRLFHLATSPLLRSVVVRLGAATHLVSLTTHHIVSDAWSLGVLVREMGILYLAFQEGRPSPLEPLAIQYGDFAAWQRKALSEEVLAAEVAHWRRELEGAPSLLDLPTDRPRGREGSELGRRVLSSLSAAATENLEGFSRREGVTVFMVLLAAFEAVLSRWSGQGDFCVGSPVAGRNRLETEGLIGFFINTLVYRARICGNDSFRQLLRRVKETSLGAYQHQNVPFEKLVEELQPERRMGTTPFFQVMFNLINAQGEELRLPGLSLRSESVDTGAQAFDLDLTVVQGNQGLNLSLSYRSDLFEEATAERFLASFERFLKAALAAPEAKLGELSLLGGLEITRQLEDALPLSQTLPQANVWARFEAQARCTPQGPALVDGLRTWTYGELAAQARRVAAALRRVGAGPEEVVGLCMERSAELIAAMLGALASGAAYLPLDPAVPSARLVGILEDAKALVVLCDGRGRLALPSTSAPCLLFDDLDPAAVVELPAAGGGLDRAAYVIYTSGSTGTPKGVVVSHRSLAAYIEGMVRDSGLHEGDRALQFASPSFDASVEEIFSALTSGAALVLRDEEMLGSPRRLFDSCRRLGVTVLNFPTAYWHALVTALDPDTTPWPEQVRLVILGGEEGRSDLLDRWRRHAGPQVRLVNTYGPTEATIVASRWQAPTDGAGLLWPGMPIGKPVEHAQLLLLDPRLRLLPQGCVGEICIGGLGVARGYFGQPVLTAERFVPDPHGREPGARLYRSGDLGRFLADFSIRFEGRIDQQLKIRGFRVDLVEIDQALGEHFQVREAVTDTVETESGERRLVAYWVPAEGGEENGSTEDREAELHRHCAARLPEYMVPAAFVCLAALPKTVTGKIDRQSLPAPLRWHRAQVAATVAPRSDTEHRMLELWQDVLGDESFGIRDGFFDLGGHSLLAVRLLAEVRSRFGRELPLAILFREPTVEALAAMLDRGAVEVATTGPLVPLQPAGQRPPIFFVHPVGGHVLCYADLARELGDEQPFFAFQAVGIDGEEPPLENLTQQARRYVTLLQEQLPEGPFVLGGWSLGGVVAFEMARQLAALGRTTELLVLVDSRPPPKQAWKGASEAKLMAQFAWDLVGHQLSESPLPFAEFKKLGEADRLQLILEQGQGAGILAVTAGLDQLRLLYKVFRGNLLAAANYRPAAFSGRALLLRTEAARRRHLGRTGWGRATQGLRVISAPGDHFSLLRPPHVRRVAEILNEHLDPEAESSTR